MRSWGGPQDAISAPMRRDPRELSPRQVRMQETASQQEGAHQNRTGRRLHLGLLASRKGRNTCFCFKQRAPSHTAAVFCDGSPSRRRQGPSADLLSPVPAPPLTLFQPNRLWLFLKLASLFLPQGLCTCSSCPPTPTPECYSSSLSRAGSLSSGGPQGTSRFPQEALPDHHI